MNNCSFIGRMGKDAELKFTKSGVAVATFSIAVTRDFKGPNGEKETDWLDVVAWKQTAEFVSNYLGRGRLVAVTGRMQRRQYDANDGSKRAVWECVANTVNGLDKPKEDGDRQADTRQDSNAHYDDPFADS